MDIEIKRDKLKVDAGSLFISEHDEIFMVIIDREVEEYALLNLKNGEIVSEFHESIEELQGFTNLSDMEPLEQIEPLKVRKMRV